MDKTTDNTAEGFSVLILGIGIFLWLSIKTLSNLLYLIFKNSLIISKYNPKTIFWESEIFYLISLTILIIVVVRMFKKIGNSNSKSLVSSFSFSIVAYVLILLMQYAVIIFWSNLQYGIHVENYSESFSNYLKIVNHDINLVYAKSGIEIMKYAVLAIIIFVKR